MLEYIIESTLNFWLSQSLDYKDFLNYGTYEEE